ncbi:MAG TPA: diiron oxygenase, partial [Polyangiaceae bacterium]
MDLGRMLERCRRDQWSVHDIDLSKPPRELSEPDEIAVCQLFTDMAVIERLAGALFREQSRRTHDETLRAIFDTFVVDEVRHAQMAQILADYYDRRRLRVYRPSPSLTRFFDHFVSAVTELEDDVANTYITAGEVILDIALLRSINDYVADDASDRAMRLINRDESRHIAIDYHMVGYYSSPEWLERKAQRPKKSARDHARAAKAFAGIIYYGQPFFRDVFFQPMELVDPTGSRMREAFKRLQLLGAKPATANTWFGRFMRTLQAGYNDPRVGRVLGPAISRVVGVGDFLRLL